MRMQPKRQTKTATPDAAADRVEQSAEPAIPKTGMSLAERMALPEPARTEALERLVQVGEQFYLRSRNGETIRQRYGAITITVEAEPRGFSAQHAIHLLFYHGDKVEEVES